MNWTEAQLRREEIDRLNKKSGMFGTEAARDLYRELLRECVIFLPDADPHGVDKRTIEEALGKGNR